VYDYSSGTKTASGERLQDDALTAAHPSLPFGTMVRVTNHRNGHTALVRINDRGPFIRGRVIDVSPAAARALGFSGVAQVSLAVVNEDDGESLTSP
jgi:rare lipoprotein A